MQAAAGASGVCLDRCLHTLLGQSQIPSVEQPHACFDVQHAGMSAEHATQAWHAFPFAPQKVVVVVVWQVP
jgi:hypothetical protein